MPGKIKAQAEAAVWRFCEAGPALPDLLLPPSSAPPDLAAAETCGASQPRGRGLDTWGHLSGSGATAPSPSRRWGSLSCPLLLGLLSFTFLFAEGWDSRGSGRPGGTPADSRSKPVARLRELGGSARPLRRLPPPALQPGLDGGRVLLLGSRGGVVVVVVEKAMEFSPESLRLGPLPARGRPTRFPPPAAGCAAPPSHAEHLTAASGFPLRYGERFSPFWPFIPPGSPSAASRGAQLARRLAGPAPLLRALPSFGVAGSWAAGGSVPRRALPCAGLSPALTLPADRRRARDVHLAAPAGKTRSGSTERWVLHLTELREFKKGTAAPRFFPLPSQTPSRSEQRCVGLCTSVAIFVAKSSYPSLFGWGPLSS